VSIDICPACGYPTIGPELCAFCRPIEVLTGDQTWASVPSVELHRGSAGMRMRLPEPNPTAQAS
jgi:hypothetical protein